VHGTPKILPPPHLSFGQSQAKKIMTKKLQEYHHIYHQINNIRISIIYIFIHMNLALKMFVVFDICLVKLSTV
jgi:hypothetical protein